MDRKDGVPWLWPHQGGLFLSYKTPLECKVQARTPSLDLLGKEGERTCGQDPETAPKGAELHPKKKGGWKPGGDKINKCPLQDVTCPFHRSHVEAQEGALTHLGQAGGTSRLSRVTPS